MTIDEAIEQEKFKARVDRIKSNKKIFHNNDEDEISACHRSAEEHERLAEWLEELKAYREIGTVEGYKSAIECYTEEYTRRKSNEQYNKAIDDFVKFASDMPMVEEEDGEYRPMRLEEIAEQLKAGVKE